MNAKAQAVVTTIPMQEASIDIWHSKYQLKTKTGEPVDKDINATYERVAKALAEVENKSVRTQHMKNFIWALQNGAIPAGRITSNAGAEAHKPATSTINCTVSGTVQDSMNDILEKNHEAGLTLKAGCGIGYEFSTLRPKGAYVAGAGATTSGPLSFMDIFDRMCFTVSSAGGRRGQHAEVSVADVEHQAPDPGVRRVGAQCAECGHGLEVVDRAALGWRFVEVIPERDPVDAGLVEPPPRGAQFVHGQVLLSHVHAELQRWGPVGGAGHGCRPPGAVRRWLGCRSIRRRPAPVPG